MINYVNDCNDYMIIIMDIEMIIVIRKVIIIITSLFLFSWFFTLLVSLGLILVLFSDSLSSLVTSSSLSLNK